MYRIIADLHTHTLVSNHAFNTITEMARTAREMGYRALAVTDHGPAMPDSPHIWYFHNLRRLPDVLEGIPVLKGAEVDVVDLEGGLDLPEELLAKLDWVTASIHTDCMPGTLTVEQATHLWLKIAENPLVDMIGHSEQAQHVYDYDAVARVFASKRKVVESGKSRLREISLTDELPPLFSRYCRIAIPRSNACAPFCATGSACPGLPRRLTSVIPTLTPTYK